MWGSQARGDYRAEALRTKPTIPQICHEICPHVERREVVGIFVGKGDWWCRIDHALIPIVYIGSSRSV